MIKEETQLWIIKVISLRYSAKNRSLCSTKTDLRNRISDTTFTISEFTETSAFQTSANYGENNFSTTQVSISNRKQATLFCSLIRIEELRYHYKILDVRKALFSEIKKSTTPTALKTLLSTERTTRVLPRRRWIRFVVRKIGSAFNNKIAPIALFLHQHQIANTKKYVRIPIASGSTASTTPDDEINFLALSQKRLAKYGTVRLPENQVNSALRAIPSVIYLMIYGHAM